MLAKRMDNPRVRNSQVSGFDGNVYRLKLSSDGLRLVYVVIDDEQVIYVVAVGKREDLEAYRKARIILDEVLQLDLVSKLSRFFASVKFFFLSGPLGPVLGGTFAF